MHPIIIVGAGRSGTNMLRDVLVALPDFATWPCDEINYIWRQGNARYPTDEFLPEMATDEVSRRIRHAFLRIARKTGVANVVEKTCANSLRIGFVDRVFPEAKYIFIIRDGRDVAASAAQRWTASLDIPYVARKVRFVPPADLPYYAARYLRDRLHRFVSHRRRLRWWGPRCEGMQRMLQEHSLEEVCALQWRRCVERSEADFARIDASRVHRLRYEELVSDPVTEVHRVLTFIGMDASQYDLSGIASSVHGQSVGKWRRNLDPDAISAIEALLGKTLKQYGYV